jgi:hypothetical protein
MKIKIPISNSVQGGGFQGVTAINCLDRRLHFKKQGAGAE